MNVQPSLDFCRRADLSSTAKLLAEVLERETRPRFGHSLLSTETLGVLIGRSVRTVQLALAELGRRGLVAVRRCRRWLGLVVNSGHVISLLWRAEPLLSGAMDCASPAQWIAPDFGPPTPPCIVSEDGLEIEADGTRTGDPDPTPPPPDVSDPAPASRRKATPDEVRAAVAKAASVLRVDVRSARARVVALARRWGLSWVVAALDRAARKQAFEPLRNPPGYVQRTLEGFEAEGGPPAPPPPALSDEELLARLNRADAEREAFIASLH